MRAEDAEALLGFLELPGALSVGLGIQTTLKVVLEVQNEICSYGISERYFEVDMSEYLVEIF